MLTDLRRRSASSSAPEAQDAVELLLSCHARILHFTRMAVRLGEAPADVSRSELAEAAAAVHRYFTIGLPLHVLDEDLSVRPRLEASERAALEQMSREHRVIERLIEIAAPVWHELCVSPERHERMREALRESASGLEAKFPPHLALEENTIFVALRNLDPATRATIAAEMRARRT